MITNEQAELLSKLREDIRSYMSGKRLLHTYAVEREIEKLCAIYAPNDEFEMRAAALLHDITKELSPEKQLQLCDEFGIIYTDEEKLTPKIFHSRTAPSVIARDFPEYSVPDILNAVRWHTTGRADMNICEMLLFLADYIEDTRTFESCVVLRRYFCDGLCEKNDDASKKAHLYDTMILAFDMTVKELLADSAPIHEDTIAARNYFIVCKRGDIN